MVPSARLFSFSDFVEAESDVMEFTLLGAAVRPPPALALAQSHFGFAALHSTTGLSSAFRLTPIGQSSISVIDLGPYIG